MTMLVTRVKYCLAGVFMLASTLANAGITSSGLFSVNHTATKLSSISDLDPSVLKLALNAYSCAVEKGVSDQKILTVIDYSRPSTEQRLWVFDLERQKVLLNSLVAHGQGSGAIMATRFSDQPQTHATSLGLFLTGDTYQGHNGYSLRLRGLEGGFNSQAESRAIVVHGAPYVNEQMAMAGRIGRSWGCPAVPTRVAQPLINTIKDGTLVFAYYPDSQWLKKSQYLHCGKGTGYSITAKSLA